MIQPTVFGADELMDDIAADLTVNGIAWIRGPVQTIAPGVVELLVGDWETETHHGGPRVVIGEAAGTYEDPADTPHATDGWIDVGGGQVARALFYRAPVFPVFVYAPAPAGTAPQDDARMARKSTLALCDAVAGAIRRTRRGLPMLPWPVRPVNDERGSFVYGGLRQIDVKIAIPVFDFPSDTLIADSAIAGGQLLVDDIPTPATPEMSTSP